MTEEIFKKYARLMLEVGVNLQPQQKLYVQMDAYHWDFARILISEAYAMGAGYVHLETSDPIETEARVQHGEETELEYVPAWVETKFQTMVDEKWARLFFFGSRDPDMASRQDGSRLGMIQRASRVAVRELSRACGAGEISWAGAALPTPKWAVKVFPEHGEEMAYEMLWNELISILKLKSEDPSAEWREIGAETARRAKKLTEYGFEQLHFYGGETDLKVSLLSSSRWIGGGSKNADGIDTIPNIPTFEMFATPDYRATSGRAKITYPVEVLGLTVLGAWFVFRDGEVVEYGAEENKEVLDRLFSLCPQAKFLGEVALVDSDSPIYKSGRVFHSILFDENAACHIALGNGYVSAVEGAEGLTQQELMDVGVNVSLVHHDLMIGCDDMNVDGISADGSRTALMRDGKFVNV